MELCLDHYESAKRRDVLFRLEQLLLNGKRVDNELEAIPREVLRTSPLLLKASGEMLLRAGRLPEAHDALADAVKGFAGQTFVRHMLSAMALLAMVQLRCGRTADAITVLRFLRDEVAGNAELADGQVFLALARGCHLLGAAESAQQYYESAIERFESDGDRESFSTTFFDMLYKQYFLLSRERWETLLRRFRRFCDLYEEMPHPVALLEAVRDFYKQRWKDVIERLDAVGFDSHRTVYIYREIADSLRLKTMALLRGEGAAEVRAAVRQMERESVPAHRADVDCLFERETVCYVWYATTGDDARADVCLRTLEMMADSGMQPGYRIAVERLKRLPVALRPPSPQFAGRDSSVPDGWRIEWFRGLRITSRDREVRNISWKRKKALELFLYLLARPHYAAPKEWVAEALFADDDGKKTANQIYVTVHRLKQVLQEHFGVDRGVVFSDGTVRLQDGRIEYVDIEKYAALVRVGNHLWVVERKLSVELYEEAVQMYDDVLPDLQYIDWLDRFRAQLSEYQAHMLKRLGWHYALACDNERAVHYFTEWIVFCPDALCQEEVLKWTIRFA